MVLIGNSSQTVEFLLDEPLKLSWGSWQDKGGILGIIRSGSLITQSFYFYFYLYTHKVMRMQLFEQTCKKHFRNLNVLVLYQIANQLC